jgi:hypothetical protein
MEDTNIETWEAFITAGERRILTTDFIVKAMEDILTAANDDMRVKCFERTSCLFTWLASEVVHDGEIKPQGMKEGLIEIPKKEERKSRKILSCQMVLDLKKPR